MPVNLTPLKDLRVLRHQIPAHGLTPNTSIQNKPLLIYKSAFTSSVTAGEIETHLSSVGVVSPQWRYSMYTTSHFHVSGPSPRIKKHHTDHRHVTDNIARGSRHCKWQSEVVFRARGQFRSRRGDCCSRRCGCHSSRRCASVDGGS